MQHLSNYNKERPSREKQLEFSAHLFELYCALAIAPDANVSEGPTYEEALRIHANPSRKSLLLLIFGKKWNIGCTSNYGVENANQFF